MKKKLIFLAALSMLFLTTLKAQYLGQVQFTNADVAIEQKDGWHIATMAGCQMESKEGKPYLPVKYLQIAIPANKVVRGIEIISVQQ
ncbi:MULTISPECIES: hypothetical protein [unclassified Lentimicrobium]|uniref:hypothetical protein n=1 Tax=unclassified Lentimicrobium TaxID=2677434 RepID=UPI001556A56E|nr:MULTISPECIES: hypothetical protein [unclassified Lentimicrobium]NPD47270.1 hypothetical protein [Lentimicrobium sp. S6]NPD86083.1 hypothetical protein [Lentimicrobium sp. L6]